MTDDITAPSRFTSRLPDVEAMQVPPWSHGARMDPDAWESFIRWMLTGDHRARFEWGGSGACFYITTRDGMRPPVFGGQWLLRHADGWFEVMSSSEFTRLYQAAPLVDHHGRCLRCKGMGGYGPDTPPGLPTMDVWLICEDCSGTGTTTPP